MPPAISIKGLTVTYGAVTAVQDCSLDVEENEIFGLLGPNGAGKSSVMKAISGQLRPSAGSIKYGKESFASNAYALKETLGLVPQDYAFAYDFTVEENLRFLAKLYDFQGKELEDVVQKQLGKFLLKHYAFTRASDLSGGYKRLLNFALSTLHSPKLLLLDEPTVGLDPDIRAKVWKIIKELQLEGRTLILSTHYLEEAAYLCDRIAIIYKGSILVAGTPDDLIDQYGGQTQILLRLSSPAEYAASSIKKVRGVTECGAANEMLTAWCANKDILRVLSGVQKMLDEKGIEVEDCLVKEPTLDDAFKTVVGEGIGVK